MKELNSAQMGVTAGSICRLPRPVYFPKGRGCSRIRAEATITLQNTSGAAADLTGATVKWALATLFDSSTLRFGDRRQEVVDAALPYARAREMFVAMSCDDFIISAAGYNSGLPKRVKDIADADVWFAGVANLGTKLVVVEFVRAFELNRLGNQAYAYCPGASQMTQLQWEFVRGGAADPAAKWAQSVAADVLWVVDDFETTDDRWATVPRIFQQEEAGRESHGPRGPVGLVAMWEYTGAGGATALTLFSVRRDGDTAVQDNVRASRVVRDAQYTDPIGAFDLNTLATVLVQLPGDAEKHDIPVGQNFKMEQTGAELAPIKSAWLHIPVRSQLEVDQLVLDNVRGIRGVKLINAAAKSGQSLSATVAALEPSVVAPEGSSDFEALPGRVAANDQAQAVDHVPDVVVSAARAQVAGAGAAKDAVAEKVANSLAKAIPGGQSGQRGNVSNFRRNIATRLTR